MVLRARHRDIEEPPFLFDLGRAANRQIGRYATIHAIENEHRLPLLSFGGMNGGKDQVILVNEWDTGLVAGCQWRIKRQFGEETLPIGVRRGNLSQLEKIGFAHSGIFETPFEMRQIPPACQIKFRRPANRIAADQAQGFGEGWPLFRTGGPRLEAPYPPPRASRPTPPGRKAPPPSPDQHPPEAG